MAGSLDLRGIEMPLPIRSSGVARALAFMDSPNVGMAFQVLASELIHQIYNNLSTVADVINLSLACRRFNLLLRNAHKLTTFINAADREFGPIEDIMLLVTYTHGQPVYSNRLPPLSYALLRQVIAVGKTAKRFEELYPSLRWDVDYISRRHLSNHEGFSVRRALYRFWLYTDAFHNRLHPRTARLLRSHIEERSQLLRNWTTEELIELEEIRYLFENMLTFELCPTDGEVWTRNPKDGVRLHWQQPFLSCVLPPKHSSYLGLFHTAHHETHLKELPTTQARALNMEGWGDDVAQYHIVQAMLKLNPAQMIWLHDHAVYKWEVEALVREVGEDWFWNNGQTLSDTWALVLFARGFNVESIRHGIIDGTLGSTAQASFSIACHREYMSI